MEASRPSHRNIPIRSSQDIVHSTGERVHTLDERVPTTTTTTRRAGAFPGFALATTSCLALLAVGLRRSTRRRRRRRRLLLLLLLLVLVVGRQQILLDAVNLANDGTDVASAEGEDIAHLIEGAGGIVEGPGDLLGAGPEDPAGTEEKVEGVESAAPQGSDHERLVVLHCHGVRHGVHHGVHHGLLLLGLVPWAASAGTGTAMPMVRLVGLGGSTSTGIVSITTTTMLMVMTMMAAASLVDGTAVHVIHILLLFKFDIVIVALHGTGAVGLVGALILEDPHRSDGTLGGGGPAHSDGGYGLFVVHVGGRWRGDDRIVTVIVRAEMGRQTRGGIQLLGGNLAVGLLEELLLETELAVVQTGGRAPMMACTCPILLLLVGEGPVATEGGGIEGLSQQRSATTAATAAAALGGNASLLFVRVSAISTAARQYVVVFGPHGWIAENPVSGDDGIHPPFGKAPLGRRQGILLLAQDLVQLVPPIEEGALNLRRFGIRWHRQHVAVQVGVRPKDVLDDVGA